MKITMAVAALALVIGNAQADWIDQYGNVYRNLPGYGEQPELFEQSSLGGHYQYFHNNDGFDWNWRTHYPFGH
jgi:hypothetical protein